MELYCGTCDCHTNHKFLGNFKDGIRLLGRYICEECGTETEDEPITKENNMKMKYFDGKELNDKKIIETLSKMASMYSNGEVIEVRDELAAIVNAIDEFEKLYKI